MPECWPVRVYLLPIGSASEKSQLNKLPLESFFLGCRVLADCGKVREVVFLVTTLGVQWTKISRVFLNWGGN